jgi:hypothetical protein
MPGVRAVLTGHDLTAAGPDDIASGMSFRIRNGVDMPKPAQPIRTTGTACSAGDPFAVAGAPMFNFASHSVPSKANPLRSKDRGKAGGAPGLP